MATYLSVAKCIRNLSSNAKLNFYDVAVTVKYASMIATMVSKLQNKQDDYNIQSDNKCQANNVRILCNLGDIRNHVYSRMLPIKHAAKFLHLMYVYIYIYQ